jgi:chromosome segregation ATPase
VTALTATQENHASLQTKAAETRRQLEQMRCELAALTKERDTLMAQVAAANEKVEELSSKLETTGLEAAKLKEFLSLQDVQKERDDAAERAQKAEDRIRELTLELHRAGIWP